MDIVPAADFSVDLEFAASGLGVINCDACHSDGDERKEHLLFSPPLVFGVCVP
jgi:hypothetical protein